MSSFPIQKSFSPTPSGQTFTASMSSFLNLRPEIRTTVYDFLLQSSLTSNTRMLYVSENTVRSKVLPSSVCRGRTHKLHEHYIPLIGDKTIWAEEMIKAARKIHRADVDDLLCLASACRLLRLELLAVAWSNADISIDSSTLFTDLHYSFHHRLSINACTFIRTLQVSVEQNAWRPRQMRKVVSLCRSRLPQLKQLILHVTVRPPAAQGFPKTNSLLSWLCCTCLARLSSNFTTIAYHTEPSSYIVQDGVQNGTKSRMRSLEPLELDSIRYVRDGEIIER